MSVEVEGIWRMELLGRDGWEPVGTAFIEGGRYLRGSSDACTVGTYRLDGDTIIIDATTSLFEGARTIYGKSSGQVRIKYEAKIKDGTLEGGASDGEYTTRFRGTRIGDLP